MAERLIKGQVVNAQNAECIYVLRNENQKLKDKINEMKIENENSLERAKQQINEKNANSSENEMLHEKVNSLLEVLKTLFKQISKKINFSICGKRRTVN